MIKLLFGSCGLASSLAIVSVLAAGCYVEETRHHPPEYAASPAPPPAPVVVENPPPPPPPIVEPAPPAPPTAEDVWIGGNYRWSGQRYEWQRGHYERRPHAGARYSTGHWEQRDRGKVWVEGRWESDRPWGGQWGVEERHRGPAWKPVLCLSRQRPAEA